jgi:crotonobetainyl-CoA:carnitine CoA-transferase CaiB-like acyl-CoA transferase
MTAIQESEAGPLAGLRIVEFAHMVMGPTCGMILGDLGAEVIKVEPVGGDSTRRLPGSGSGFFAMFNRNKKSLALDVADPRGREVLARLVGTADVFTENFKGGAMAKLGLDYASLARHNERLIYVSLKGFLPGPYESRTALDEVVQMMGGLAYMTGPEGRPLRAGTAVNDIMGGLFGALGALAALRERDRTGQGRQVQSALFENNVFLMGMHMMQYAVTGEPPAPMPGRIAAWAVYDVFEVKDGAQIFLAVVSDTQWAIFCDAFGYADLKADARLATNAERVAARAWMMPLLRERLAAHDAAQIARIFDAHQLPYAPIARPHELFDDPHLVASGGLADVEIPADGSRAGRPIRTRTPLLPITVDGRRFALRRNPPALGEHTRELLCDLGYADDAVTALALAGVVRDAHGPVTAR